MPTNPAQRRYLGRRVIVSITYVAAIFLASTLLPKGSAATPARAWPHCASAAAWALPLLSSADDDSPWCSR